uniref:BTB domain-containing protein n=1 Tax=Onchocerca volvulus TaxID=6282 RepID=A0A8R1Y0G2_ONCVO
MAHFIKKIVDRTRSRSKSPVKYHRNDYEQWKEMQHQQYSSHYGSSMRTYDYFVHPTYDQQFQNFHASISFCLNGNSEGHLWDAHPVQRSLHSTASHHSDFIHPNNELIIPIPSSPIHSDIMDKQNETFDSSSSPANNRSNTSIPSAKQKELDVKKKHITRPRSISPQKTPQTSFDETSKKSRSKSPVKRFPQILETLDYLSPQCQLGGCSATLIVQDTKFLVCKHQLSHASDYFRALFLANKSIPKSGAYHNSCNEFAIVVSSFRYPPPAIQFKWFLESTIQSSIFSDITEVEIADDKLETCMRLSKRFRAKSLEAKCARYIQDNVVGKTPMVALCWLNWVLKHKFDQTTYDACLPCVATASVRCLEEHRNLISERLLADLLAAKLRTLYDQAVTVFQTIHSMDHFYVDVPKCPNCGRQREQGKVRIQASPCRKMLGCERCLREYSCNLSGKDHKDLQACYQCKHGLVPLNDHTADCQCQIPLLASHLKGLQPHFLSLISHH